MTVLIDSSFFTVILSKLANNMLVLNNKNEAHSLVCIHHYSRHNSILLTFIRHITTTAPPPLHPSCRHHHYMHSCLHPCRPCPLRTQAILPARKQFQNSPVPHFLSTAAQRIARRSSRGCTRCRCGCQRNLSTAPRSSEAQRTASG